MNVYRVWQNIILLFLYYYKLILPDLLILNHTFGLCLSNNIHNLLKDLFRSNNANKTGIRVGDVSKNLVIVSSGGTSCY